MVAVRTVSLGRGQRVPYPVPTSAAASNTGRGNRRADTTPEILLRSELHRFGLRFRKDHPIRVSGRRPVRADVAFTRARVAVFVDGCFWHSCPDHGQVPESNNDYWVPKLKANVARDSLVTRLVTEAGWLVIRVWEHETVASAVERIRAAVEARRQVPVGGTGNVPPGRPS